MALLIFFFLQSIFFSVGQIIPSSSLLLFNSVPFYCWAHLLRFSFYLRYFPDVEFPFDSSLQFLFLCWVYKMCLHQNIFFYILGIVVLAEVFKLLIPTSDSSWGYSGCGFPWEWLTFSWFFTFVEKFGLYSGHCSSVLENKSSVIFLWRVLICICFSGHSAWLDSNWKLSLGQ